MASSCDEQAGIFALMWVQASENKNLTMALKLLRKGMKSADLTEYVRFSDLVLEPSM